MPCALVVDDSRATRTVLARILSQSGIETVQAANGLEAMHTMEREVTSFDLVLLDWNMPELSGIEVLEWIRARDDFRSIRVVMVTTETEIEQMARALQTGADEYLMKPFTREALQDKLRLIGLMS